MGFVVAYCFCGILVELLENLATYGRCFRYLTNLSMWHIFPARFLSSSFLSSFFFLLSSAYSGSAPGCTVLVKGKRCIQGSFIGPTSSRVDVICFGFISNPFPVFYHSPHFFPPLLCYQSLIVLYVWFFILMV